MEKRQRGFTLIELLVVVAIIGIVAAIAIPNLLDAMNRARFKATMGDIRTIAEGVESYQIDLPGRVPNAADMPSLAAILDGAGYLKNPPTADGWGVVTNYTVWNTSTLTDYTLASGGADWVFQLSDFDQVASKNDLGIASRDTHGWTCDIVFQDGHFIFGLCSF